MLDRFHPPVEEYLETIFALEEEGIPVIQARLAERLGKAAPSVSEMLDRLESDGLIARSARQITMTAEGRRAGRGRGAQAPAGRAPARRRDRPRLGQGPRRGRPLGARDLRRRRGATGRAAREPDHLPARQPHPGRRAGPARAAALAEAQPGERIRLERITESVEHDAESLTYLGDHGLTPGITARDRGPGTGRHPDPRGRRRAPSRSVRR